MKDDLLPFSLYDNFYSHFPFNFFARFDNVTFSNNHGNDSSAIRFTTALPYGSIVGVTPEFINCTIKNHYMPIISRTRPFTSHRVNLKFTGSNIFQQNFGGKDLEL